MGEALLLMVYGMAGVFVFLIILVFLMGISASFFKKHAHLFPEEQAATVASGAASSSGTAEQEIAVALAAVKARG